MSNTAILVGGPVNGRRVRMAGSAYREAAPVDFAEISAEGMAVSVVTYVFHKFVDRQECGGVTVHWVGLPEGESPESMTKQAAIELLKAGALCGP